MTSPRLSLVVLAAGMGSRFGGPKQVEAVGPSGEIILDYSVHDALRAGFSRIVFVVRDEVEAYLRRHLSATSRRDIEFVTQRLDDLPAGFRVSPSRVKPWGTGHAVIACRDAIPGPFAVVNADDFYGADAFHRVAQFLRDAAGPPTSRNALVGYALGATLTEHGLVSRGLCEDNGGRLASIVERHGVGRRDGSVGYQDGAGWHPVSPDAVASMNFWGLDASTIPLLTREFERFLSGGPDDRDEFRLPSAIGALIARGELEVSVLRTDAAWLGVTHREDLVWAREALRARIAAGEYPTPLRI